MLVGIITLITSIVVSLNHHLAWLLAIYPGLYLAYVLFVVSSKAPELDSPNLTPSEEKLWRRYHLFLRHPLFTKGTAGTLAILQPVLVVSGVILAISGLYYGGLLALGWFLLKPPMERLYPLMPRISYAAEKKGDSGKLERIREINLLGDKLYSANSKDM